MTRSDRTGRMDSIQTPIIPAIGAMIEATPGTISLGQGVVHFAPPPAAAAAIEAFWQDPLNHQYGPIEGNDALRACIRAKLAEENGQQVGESQIIVTAGSNMAFLNTVLAITDPGDEIILPAPYYFNQEMAVRSVGCKPVIVTVGEDHSPDAASIANAISSRTRAVVTVSPNNPTGAVYSEPLLYDINRLCAEHGVYHISDEAYEYFVYDSARHFSPGSIEGSGDHTISLYSLSKAYGFASWRIGYLVCPDHLLNALKKVQDTNVICPAVISQYAALGAMQAGRAYCEPFVSEMATVRQSVLDTLRSLGDRIKIIKPMGAFYVLVQVPGCRLDDLTLSRRLIEEYGVATVPGRAFGSTDRCCLRVSYGALQAATVIDGIGRLAEGLACLA